MLLAGGRCRMKLLEKLVLKSLFALMLFATCLAHEKQSFSSLMKSAYKASQADAGKILLEAEEKTLNLNEKIENATLELKDQAEKQYKELHRESQHEIEEIKRNAQESIKRIEKTIEEQANELRSSVKESEAQLKVKASQEVLDLLDEADEKILEQRRITRREHFAKQIGSDKTLNLSLEWKNKAASQINSTISMLKNIVLDGEDDETSQEFAKQFSSYQQWFDTSLSMTQSRYEKRYAEIIKRKERLEDLAEMQKKADELLNDYKKKENIDDEEHKKLRLLVLYDLNSAYHAHNKRLSNEAIEEIVSNIIITPPESLHKLLTAPEEQTSLVTLAVAEEHKKTNQLLSEENQRLQKQIEEKKHDFLNAEVRANKLAEQLHECQETLSMTANQLAGSQKEIANLTTTIEDLKRKEVELDYKILEIKTIKTEILEYKDKIASLEKLQLEQATEQHKLQQEIEKRRTQKQELKKTVQLERKQRLSSELSYNKAQRETEHCHSRIRLLNEQIEIEKKEQERLLKKIKQKEEAIQALEQQTQELKALEPKLIASQEQLEWYQKQQEQARTYQENQHKIHQNLSQQLSKQEITMNNQQKELQLMQEQLSRLINDKNKTETLLKQERTKHQEEKISTESLSLSKQAEAKEKIEYLEAKINRIESEKKGLEDSFSEAAQTLVNAQKKENAKAQEAIVKQELAQQEKEESSIQMSKKRGALEGLEQQVIITTGEVANFAEGLIKEKESLYQQQKNLEQTTNEAALQFKQLEEQATEIQQGVAKELKNLQQVTHQSLEQIQQGKMNLQINEQRAQEEFMEQEKKVSSEKESIEAMLTHMQ